MIVIYLLLTGIALILLRLLVILGRIAEHSRLVDSTPNTTTPAWSTIQLSSLREALLRAQSLPVDHAAPLMASLDGAADSSLGRLSAPEEERRRAKVRATIRQNVERREWPKYLKLRLLTRLQDNVAVSRGETTVAEAWQRDEDSEKEWRLTIDNVIIPHEERGWGVEEVPYERPKDVMRVVDQ
jgi:hypothetical protein